MRVAVIGSRTFQDYALLEKTLDMVYISDMISGGCSGTDKLAEQYASEKNIPVQVIPDPDPERDSREHTTPERIFALIRQAQLVVAFWNGKSQGTGDLIRYAKSKGKQVKVVYFRE